MAKAYEAGGKLYEAMIALALNRQKKHYHWEETLPGVGVVSDFVIYDKDSPVMTLLVTHSTSESGTHMKYWRNIEELFDLKSYKPSMTVCNITFFSSWKPELAKIATAVFDGDFNLERKPYAADLGEETAQMLPHIKGVSKNDTVSLLENKMKTAPYFAELFSQFERDFIYDVLEAKTKDALRPLWESEKKRCDGTGPLNCRISNTWFKCGLIKLAFFTVDERQEIYTAIEKRRKLSSIIKEKIQLFFGPSGSRIGMVDQHLNYVVENLGSKLTENVITGVEKHHGAKVLDYLQIGRNTSALISFINDDIASIFSLPQKQAEEYIVSNIQACYDADSPHRNTFLDLCFVLCKFSDSRFSYDVAVREGNIAHGSGPDRFGGVDRCILGNELPSADTLSKLSQVLYARLTRVTDYAALIKEILPNSIHQNYVTLVKHRTINYLHELVEQKFRSMGWTIENTEEKFRSCLSDYANAPINTGDITFTYTLSNGGKRVLLQVICAYTATHKHKELPGKLRAARYSWDKKNQRFEVNANFRYNAVILLLDGCWSSLFASESKLIECFRKSGWTKIICIDEFMQMNDLLN